MLKMVCNDVQVEPVLQEITGEVLTPGTNAAVDAQLDIHACGFWSSKALAFLMLEFATRMQNLKKASPQNKSSPA